MADTTTTTTPAEPKEAFRPRFRSQLRFARISPRKLRYVADLIRGKDYNAAVAILRACPKRGAVFCRKALDSAMANATHIIGSPDTVRKQRDLYPVEALRDIDVDQLQVVEVRVDPGPYLKRWRPSSQRRPLMIKKRFSHLEIVLQEKKSAEGRAKTASAPAAAGAETPASEKGVRKAPDRKRKAAPKKASAGKSRKSSKKKE